MRLLNSRDSQTQCKHRHTQSHSENRLQHILKYWFFTNALVAGVFALLWLLLRTGTKPSRLAYPCQQAAISAATLAFGAPLVSTVISARRKLAAGLRTPVGMAVAALGLMVTAGTWGYAFWANQYAGPVLDPPRDYRAQVFHVTDCPQNPVGDHFVGLERLVSLMGREGLKFYQSASESLVAGPDGIIAADDVVIIKINYLPDERGCTNSDLLRGLIRGIVDHPDGFTGEVVVCENTQTVDTNGLDRPNNNAQDITLSPHDVVVGFQSQGYTVSHYIWTDLQAMSVGEYSDSGDLTDGYVVGPYDAEIHGRVSYPKFQTDYGTYISLRYGVWDPVSETYDDSHFKWISVPILKSHHSTYGVTACVKMHMGTGTGVLDTNQHNAIYYGILGKLLAEVRMPDLNILDGIWILANPYAGPYCPYGAATRKDMLFASVDPVALDIWSVKNVLIPAFIENYYSPPWPYPSADPDDPDSMFRIYLDRSMYYLLDAGYDVTNDLSQIDAYAWNGAGDFDGDHDVDLADFGEFDLCFTGPGGGPLSPECAPGDFDADDDIDCADWNEFIVAWTDTGDPPVLEECPDVIPPAAEPGGPECVAAEDCTSAWAGADCVGGHCYVPKNRYLSIDPTTNEEAVALEVTLTAAADYPSAVGRVWWVDEPRCYDYPDGNVVLPAPSTCEGPDRFGWVAGLTAAPVTRVWTEAPVHLTGCGIAPVVTYEIRTSHDEGTTFSESLEISTIHVPSVPQFWGDVTGGPEPGQPPFTGSWLPPDRSMGMGDIQAAIKTFENVTEDTGSPPGVWVDVEVNQVVNMGDIQFLVTAFEGAQYADLPDLPFIGVHPADCP